MNQAANSTAASHVVIVEDDEKIAALLADYCRAAGYRATQIGNGCQAVAFLRETPADLLLLDLMLPGMDGIEVCQAVRGFATLPIIMLTARIDEVDRLLGLDAGADDYVCKPFSPREVMARVKAQLRRAQGSVLAAAESTISIDAASMRIAVKGAPLNLTPVEYRLLAELIGHPERVYSRQQLLDLCHNDQRDTSDRTIDSHIKNIRRKLAAALPGIDCLQSVYGVGYRFELA
ncbi:MAG TPA: response regulator [Burkholderiaceae bacterium]